MLGTHNSLSFNKPQWWLRPFSWMAKCQSVDLTEQWNNGARYFDIRFKVKGTKLISGHGLMTYNVNVISQLDILNKLAKESRNVCYIRALVENKKDAPFVSKVYWDICAMFPHLRFLGLIIKSPWEVIITTEYTDKISEIHGYKFFKWYNFLCPKYWSKRLLKKNLEINHNNKYLILDFIENYTKHKI